MYVAIYYSRYVQYTTAAHTSAAHTSAAHLPPPPPMNGRLPAGRCVRPGGAARRGGFWAAGWLVWWCRRRAAADPLLSALPLCPSVPWRKSRGQPPPPPPAPTHPVVDLVTAVGEGGGGVCATSGWLLVVGVS